MPSKRFVLGVAAVGVAALVAGCTGGDEPAAGGTDALSEIRAAAARTAGTTAHVTLSVPRVEVTGDVDPAGKAMALDVTTEDTDGSTTTSKIVVLDSDAYRTMGETYLRGLDPTMFIRFPTDTFATASILHLADPFDPAGLKALSPALTSARRTDDGGFSGTLDLTKAPDDASRGLLPHGPDQLAGAGDVVTDIPFEADVDGEGYLTSMTVRMPAYGQVPAYASTTTFADFGEPVAVQRPEASEIADVPDELRELLAGE
jgi:hypothetical protein